MLDCQDDDDNNPLALNAMNFFPWGRSGGGGSQGSGGRGSKGSGGGGGDDDPDDPMGLDPYAEVTFDSIGGLESQIEWLMRNIVDHLKDPKIKELWGVTPPRGVMMYGPPGTGKTLLARAFGNEISSILNKPVKFYHRKGGDLLSKFFGGSAQLIRDLFADAKKTSPSIIFLDELDGLCSSRDDKNAGQARVSVVTALLGQMDVIEPGTVFVFAATNRIDCIDAAMKRPGRFDKELQFFVPAMDARKSIITLHTQKWKRSHPSVELLETLGHKTAGYTGADLENLCRETFLNAFERHVPDLTGPKVGTINDMEILSADWMTVLDKTKPTSGASFGSALYLPKLPSTTISPLIGPIQNEIVDMITPILPKDAISTTSADISLSSCATVRTCYVWNDSSNSPNWVTESLILPGVFTHAKMGDVPIFLLDKVCLLSKHSPHHLITTMVDVIRQAEASPKPCILYIPQMKEILKILADDAFHLLDQVTHLRGKHVLLVATGTHPPNEISYHPIRSLFTGPNQVTCTIRRNSESERKLFFEQSVTQLKKQWPNFYPAFNEVQKSILTRTGGDAVETLIKLKDQMSMVTFMNKDKNGSEFLEQLNKMLNTYSKNKFKI